MYLIFIVLARGTNEAKMSEPICCKVCKKKFCLSGIVKHIKHKQDCNEHYTDEEIKVFQKITSEKRNLKRRESYDPKLRKISHLKRKTETTKRSEPSDTTTNSMKCNFTENPKVSCKYTCQISNTWYFDK